MLIAIIILIILLMLSFLGIAILVPRMIRMQEVIYNFTDEEAKSFTSIYGVMLEFSEHLKSVAELDLYRSEPNLTGIAKHSDYVVTYIENIEDKAVHQWEDWSDVKKRIDKPFTVAQISTVPRKEDREEKDI